MNNGRSVCSFCLLYFGEFSELPETTVVARATEAWGGGCRVKSLRISLIEFGRMLLTLPCSVSPQINCVTFPSFTCLPEQQLLKPNEWSYCDYFWVKITR